LLFIFGNGIKASTSPPLGISRWVKKGYVKCMIPQLMSVV